MANPLPYVVHRHRANIIAAIAVIVFLTIISVLTAPADAGKSIVTVFADGEERLISTTVLTVGEALERAEIDLGPNDLVEPGLDTFINDSSFRINVYRAKPITVIDGDEQATVLTPYNSPRLIAESAGITVYPEDHYHFELINDIIDAGAVGERLVIDRAAAIKVNVYGEVIEHRTHAATVGEALDEMGVNVAEKDNLTVPRETPLTTGMNVGVLRTGTDIINVDEKVQHPVKYIYDSNKFMGDTEIQTPGFDAIYTVTYKVKLENGVEVGRTEISRVRKKAAVTEVQIVGTKVVDPSSNVALGQAMAERRGWTGAEWQCLYSLWMKESGWNHTTSNYQGSGAYGIPQALPGSKMASHGADWATNPRTQIWWGMDYIAGRYGTPCGAWEHSERVGWY